MLSQVSAMQYGFLTRRLRSISLFPAQPYNSTDKNIGYNLTEGGDGGNTYMFKSEKEMDEIKHKISIANSGKNNAQSKQIKAFNVITNEVLHFDTLHDACKYFNHRQKYSFVKHCEIYTDLIIIHDEVIKFYRDKPQKRILPDMARQY